MEKTVSWEIQKRLIIFLATIIQWDGVETFSIVRRLKTLFRVLVVSQECVVVIWMYGDSKYCVDSKYWLWFRSVVDWIIGGWNLGIIWNLDRVCWFWDSFGVQCFNIMPVLCVHVMVFSDWLSAFLMSIFHFWCAECKFYVEIFHLCFKI